MKVCKVWRYEKYENHVLVQYIVKFTVFINSGTTPRMMKFLTFLSSGTTLGILEHWRMQSHESADARALKRFIKVPFFSKKVDFTKFLRENHGRVLWRLNFGLWKISWNQWKCLTLRFRHRFWLNFFWSIGIIKVI